MSLSIFLATAPGLEPLLRAEAVALGLAQPQAVPGGVTVTGDWPEVWRANLRLRGATRVLVHIAEFRALHLACLLYTSPSPRDGLLSRMPSSA